MNSYTRKYEALGYNTIRSAKLTSKQYLVYSYLVSISKWNAEAAEDHYFVYKNSFQIKEACEKLNISQPTWRAAIQKLYDLGYINYEYDEVEDKKTGEIIRKEKRSNKFYEIRIIKPYSPL